MERRITHQEAPQWTANKFANALLEGMLIIGFVLATWIIVAGIFSLTEIHNPANRGSQPLDGPAGHQQYRAISSTAATTAPLPVQLLPQPN